YNARRSHSSLGDRTPVEYERAWYDGERPQLRDEAEDQTLRGTNGRYLRRDNNRDINPRTLEHAG
ncbi:MAG: hypothetical protein HKP61_03040, partial [Dactylosporangium sp.]|nr:hypothetical protein [Dactylosporangium sp.]NNJ59931.1 hypothetical protein [Dactylosporangium sp.]